MIFEGRDLVDHHDAELAQLRLRFEREIETGLTRWGFPADPRESYRKGLILVAIKTEQERRCTHSF